MQRSRRFVYAAAGTVALIIGFVGLGRSQEVPLPDTTIPEPAIFARVDDYKQANVALLERFLLYPLNSQSEDVAEEGVRVITRLALAQPTSMTEGIIKALRTLVREGITPSIRYEAMLVLQVYRNPTLFTGLADQDFKTSAEMYTAISHRLDDSLLVGTY